MLFEDDDCPEEYKKRWENNYFSVGARNVSYIYSILINYWGKVPLITSNQLNVPAAEIREISDYVLQLMNHIPNDRDFYAMCGIWSQVLLRRDIEDYQLAHMYYNRVIDSGIYRLSENSYIITPDMQLMEVYDLAGDGILNDYPLCLPEIYLGTVEGLLKSHDSYAALYYLHIIQDWLQEKRSGQGEDLYVVLQDLSLRILNGEDKTFMLYKRWDMLEEKLAPFGFVSRNKLLPIPASALDSNKNLQQNPGY